MTPHPLDRDLEATLRRYRPAGPPAALRDRCVMVRGPRSWPLAAAAALLLAFAAGLYDGASDLAPRGAVRHADQVERDLAEWLGGRPADYALARELAMQASDRERDGGATMGVLATDPGWPPARALWESDK